MGSGTYYDVFDAYNGRLAKNLGITLLILNTITLAIIIGMYYRLGIFTVTLALLDNGTDSGVVVFYFVPFFPAMILVYLAGGLGICAGRSKSAGLIKGQMAIGILSLLLCLASALVAAYFIYLFALGPAVLFLVLSVVVGLLFFIMFILLAVAAHQGSLVTCCASANRIV